MLGKVNLRNLYPNSYFPKDFKAWIKPLHGYPHGLSFTRLLRHLVGESFIKTNTLLNDSESYKYKGLEANLRQFVNQPFLKLEFSYGDELILHFGNPQKYSTPKSKEQYEGSHILTTRASEWFLFIKQAGATQVILDTNDEKLTLLHLPIQPLTKKEIEAQTYIEAGAKVKDVALIEVDSDRNPTLGVSGLGFCLSLENAYFLLIPDLSGQDEEDEDSIADWELFMPEHRYLRVGPGLTWSCTSSLEPVG